MLRINIPAPCQEDWNAMSPAIKGRFCNSCQKIVTDFTAMTDAEVKSYLLNRQNEKLCGRFSNAQLNRIQIQLPVNILQFSMPVWKKFLVACLIVFSTSLFSCDIIGGESIGKVKNTTATSTLPNDTALQMTTGVLAMPIDTIEVAGALMGDYVLMPPAIDTTEIIGEIMPPDIETVIVPEQIMGKIAIEQTIKPGVNTPRDSGVIAKINDTAKIVEPKPVVTKIDSLNCSNPPNSYQ